MTIQGKFVAGGYISPGMVVHLDYGQFDARRHRLVAAKEPHSGRKDQSRRPYKVDSMIYFKAGEEIGIDGVIDRQLQNAIGVTDAQLVAANAAKPGTVKAVSAARKGAITKARNRLKDAQADAAHAQKAFDEAKPEKKAAAEQKLAAAVEAVTAAQAALARVEEA